MAEVTPQEPQSAIQSTMVDWSSDQTAFKGVPWGKAMMWIFLLSDTFIFTCFLVSYMTIRMTTGEPWPEPSLVFGLTVFGYNVPLLLIAIMTFILITSSGTMAMAVNMGYQGNKKGVFWLMLATALLGLSFVGMQAFEWTKLMQDGIFPMKNAMEAAPQFGSIFFMVTGFHGLHVSAGVVYLITIAIRVIRGKYEEKGYDIVEITGLYWHFVDLVWVFIFAFFYLW